MACYGKSSHPKSKSLIALQKNLHKALHQAKCVVIDSRRMKSVRQRDIEQELRRLAPKFKSLKKPILIKDDGSIIDVEQ